MSAPLHAGAGAVSAFPAMAPQEVDRTVAWRLLAGLAGVIALHWLV